MNPNVRSLSFWLLLSWALGGWSFAAGAAGISNSGVRFSTEDELLRDAQEGPCENRRRLKAVRELFAAAGAGEDVIFLDSYKKIENLRIQEPSLQGELILVGAHWDKAPRGCGAVDNWTGIVAMAHLYRTLRPVSLNKQLVFVAFGKEEQGLLGSRAMVRALPSSEEPEVCAMVNLDSLGLTHPQAAENLSSRSLTEATEDLAERMNIPFGQGAVAGNSDSTPFLERGIPAITLHGLPENFRQIIHTIKDQPASIDSRSLYLGYRLALGLLAEIDRAPCDAWR